MLSVKSVVTVQNAGDSLYACKTIHRPALIRGMEELSYELVDKWWVPELSVNIPTFPENSVPQDTGLYFQLRKEPGQHGPGHVFDVRTSIATPTHDVGTDRQQS